MHERMHDLLSQKLNLKKKEIKESNKKKEKKK
jgi:hypothetical protein